MIFLCALGLYAFKWAAEPSVSKSPESAVEGAVSTQTYNELNNDYFSTYIPSNFVQKSQNKTIHGNTLLQLFYANKSSLSDAPIKDQLGITIGTLTQEGLNGLSDVHLRTRNSTDYNEIIGEAFSEGSRVFEKQTGDYEISVFVPHGSHYAAVVMSGTTDRSTEISNQIKLILKSWQWHVE